MRSEEGMGKRIYILAGPNGAGKTTFAREFLTHEANCPVFINADLIAEGLSPFAPERAVLAAGRIMLQMIRESVQRGESFGFETTLAGRGYARSIPDWRRAGYDVRLLFLSLPTPEVAIERVSERVRQGGHAVAEEVIRRRFRVGLENFEDLYKPIVTSWILYDNAGEELVIVDYGENP
ncbi:MAG: zeta toxin family protein [bacterium]